MNKPSAKPSENFVKIGQASKILGVSIDTLRRWEKAGKITVQRTAGGTRLYPLSVKIGDASKILGVSIDTLRRWEANGKIETIRSEGGTRLYPLVSLNKKSEDSIKPQPVKTETVDPLSTESLLKKANNPDQSVSVDQYISESVDLKHRRTETLNHRQTDVPTHRHTDTLTKFLIGSAGMMALTLILTSFITGLYFAQPKLARQLVKGNVASSIISPFNFLAEEMIAIIDPQKAKELGLSKPEPPPPVIPDLKSDSSQASLIGNLYRSRVKPG
ncbi:MAG: helix-turn-helix domain-containing protein, partial [Candidatus Daviesbacteria bacterium]|nr:helix-turn-helix domain-containing protein [Candidatus Daviesbacteria bacterium]